MWSATRARDEERRGGHVRSLGEDQLKNTGLDLSAELLGLSSPLLVLLGLDALAQLDERQLADLRGGVEDRVSGPISKSRSWLNPRTVPGRAPHHKSDPV